MTSLVVNLEAMPLADAVATANALLGLIEHQAATYQRRITQGNRRLGLPDQRADFASASSACMTELQRVLWAMSLSSPQVSASITRQIDPEDREWEHAEVVTSGSNPFKEARSQALTSLVRIRANHPAFFVEVLTVERIREICEKVKTESIAPLRV